MAGYTDTELESAVSQFVKNTITVERDPLGPVKQDVKFSEVLELFSSSLIFNPNAIFYLIYLASNRLNKDVIATLANVDDLYEAVQEMGKRTTEISKTTLLGEAAAALVEVDTVLSQRGALNNSAFSRYLSSINSFTDASLAPNIRREGDINRPPQKAREDARALLTTIDGAYSDHVTVLTRLQGMLAAFNVLDLPVLTIQDSVRKVRRNLQDMQTTFEDTTTSQDDKIAQARDAYLDLAAGKSILNNYTNVDDPSSPRMSSSSSLLGRTVAPPLGEGEFFAAEVAGAVSAPWSIETGVNDELNIAEDGASVATTYTIVPPAFPSVQSYLAGDYDIHAASAAAVTGANTGPFTIPSGSGADFQVSITAPGLAELTTFSGSLTSGSRTAAQVAADIGAMTDGSNPLSSYVTVADVGGAVVLTHQTSGDYLISINENPNSPVPSPSVNSVVGLLAGVSGAGQAANNLLEIDGLSPRIALTVGTRTRAQIASDVNTWAAANYPVYSAQDDGAFVTITKEEVGAVSIRMSADNDTDTVLEALAELGFYEGQTDSADAVTAAEVAEVVNAAGKLSASVSKTIYEEGDDGACTAGLSVLTVGTVEDGRTGTLYIRTGPNAGHYPIVSVSSGDITIDGTFPESGTEESWVIVYEVLVLTSKSSTVASEIDVQAGSANAALGLSVATALATTTSFRAADSGVDQNFSQADVVEGDILRRTVGASTTDHNIIDVSDDLQLEVDPPLTIDTAIQFQLLSVASIAHETFLEDAEEWQQDREDSLFASDIQELNRVMNPLLVNKNPSAAQIDNAETAITSFRRDLLEPLNEHLESFEVASVGRIDAGLRMLLERGLDRAYDTLLDGDITSFFGFDKDDASSAAYMLKTTRGVVQSDLRISKTDEDADDIIHDELIVDTDAEFDFSDIDQDEKFDPPGEAPDVSDVDEDILKIRF